MAHDLDIPDLSVFSKSCRAFHNIISPFLYRLVKNEAALMCWAVDEGNKGTLERLLEAGANPNIAWVQTCTRSSLLRVLEAYEPYLNALGRGRRGDAELRNPLLHDWTSVHSDSLISDGEDTDIGTGTGTNDDDDDDDSNSEASLIRADIRGIGVEDLGDLASQYYWTPIHIAARWGNDELVDLLLKHGANIHALSKGLCDCVLPAEDIQTLPGITTPAPIWMPLHIAICHGHESTARLLLSRGASINVSPRCLGSDVRHITALHTACYSDMTSISRFLIDEGHQTEVDVEDHIGATPVSYAYFTGSWASIDFLVEMGASLNACLGSLTLLKHACGELRFAEALRLIELGVDISASFSSAYRIRPILHSCCWPVRLDMFLRSPLRECSQQPFRTQVLRALIDAGADLEARNIDQMTPLMVASRFSVYEAVEVLLDEGADVNARDDRTGDTALLKACRPLGTTPEGAMLRTVKALLTYMPPNVDTFGALERVCAYSDFHADKVDVVRLLIEHGRSGTLGTKAGQLLLTKGLVAHNFDLCDLLLENGLRQPMVSDILPTVKRLIAEDCSDALSYILSKFPQVARILKRPQRVYDTIKRGAAGCAEVLINAGAPIDYQADNSNCLIEACRLEGLTVATLLLNKGANPNLTVGGIFPLTHPILMEDLEMIELLLDHGATMHSHPDGTKINGRIFGPLDLAIFCGLDEAVSLMIDHDNYFLSTQEERLAHFQTACCVGEDAFHNGKILDILLDAGDVDPDTIFPGVNMTPLHLSMALFNLRAVTSLVAAGANIHQIIPPSEHSPATPSPNPFEGTTPLEWAIDNAPVPFIVEMLDVSFEEQLEENPDVPLMRYVRAACRRHKPDVIEFLLNTGLDPNACDDAGNSFLSIFCETIDNIWPYEDPDWPASKIASRSAGCIVELLNHGADPFRKNAEGVSALDHMRRMMTYDGSSDFHQEVARSWKNALELDETGVYVSCIPPDDSTTAF